MEVKKENFVFVILTIIVISLLVFTILKVKKISKLTREAQISIAGVARANVPSNAMEIYNTPCPEITMTSIEGETYDFSNLVGNVIILKFSKFYKRNLSDLVYLDHVVDKYKEEAISLFFINSMGKHYAKKINLICSLQHPIIEDNGEISALFNAGTEDIVIVDRDFNIKFRFSDFPKLNKSLAFNEIMRWTFGDCDRLEKYDISSEELCLKLSEIVYYDVFQNKTKLLNLKNKKTIITLFTSTCLECEDNARIHLLKDVSRRLSPKKCQIILLFGKGNNEKAIKEFAEINNWDKFSFQIGILKKLDHSNERDYFRLFAFDVDPRTFILNKKGELVFSENFRNTNSINLKLLL